MEKRMNAYRTVESNTKPLASSASTRKEKRGTHETRVDIVSTPASFNDFTISPTSPFPPSSRNENCLLVTEVTTAHTTGVTCVLREFQSAPLSGQPSSSSSSSTGAALHAVHLIAKVACRWTCESAWDRREHSTTSRRGVHIHSGCCLTQAESGLRSVAGTRHSCLSLPDCPGRVTL